MKNDYQIRKDKKFKVWVTVLSILLGLSLTSTIVLAAFSASKSGSVTLTFAEGLTMSLSPKGASGTIQITAATINDATFNYAPSSNNTEDVTFDGISATLNKEGWVSYQIVLAETTSGQTLAGAWSISSNTATFTPTGTQTDWRCVFTGNSNFTLSQSGFTLTATGSAKWLTAALTKDLFTSIVFRGQTSAAYIDDLAGRSFTLSFTISANTSAAPTFS